MGRRMLFRLIALLLVPLLVVMGSPGARAALAQAPPVSVVVDGQRLNTEAFIIDGRTLVPLRAIFEALGAAVAWDGATRTVTATKGRTVVRLTIDQPEARVNGQPVVLAVPAQIINERTYVPVRFVSEALGAQVGFDNDTRTVTVTTGGQAGVPGVGGLPTPGGPAPAPPGGPSPAPPGGAAAPPAPPDQPAGAAAARLAGALVDAPTLAQAVAATREALARGGVTTADGDAVLVQALAPAASALALPVETLNLALEARHRATDGTLTLDRLGQALQDLGWPFLPGSAPGGQLVQLLAAWTADARGNPADPLNFTPLFLAEMARRQSPAVDLVAGTYKPEELRLTGLELALFAAHFDRLTNPPQSGAQPGPRLASARMALAADPCSIVKKWLGGFGGDAWKLYLEGQQIGLKDQVKSGLKSGLEKAGVSELGAQRFGQALSALAVLARLQKLAAIYKYTRLQVTVESENPLHKAAPSEATKYSAFTARAGISDQDWADYQQGFASSGAMRAARDCFRQLGLPTLPDVGDIGQELQNWRVEWRLVEGSPEHARVAGSNIFSHPGQLQMPLQRAGSNSGTATLDVELTDEKTEHQGSERRAPVTAEATLETSMPISLGTLVNALKGGKDVIKLVDALVEVGAGWFQEMKQPTRRATLNVIYHEGGSFVLEFDSLMYGEDVGPAYTYTLQTRARVPVQASAGSAPLEYVVADWGFGQLGQAVSEACSLSVKARGSTLSVKRLTADFDVQMGPALTYYDLRALEAVIDPGNPEEEYTMHCVTGAGLSADSAHWLTWFDALHEDERAPDGGFTVRDWTPVGERTADGGLVLANKKYQRTRALFGGVFTVTEDTTLKVIYMPPKG